MLLSNHTTEQTSEVIHELKPLLAKGGYKLTILFLNLEEFFDNTEITSRESKHNPKKLGLEWIAGDYWLTDRRDQKFLQIMNRTRRLLLSTVLQVFDPLGCMAPCDIRRRLSTKAI